MFRQTKHDHYRSLLRGAGYAGSPRTGSRSRKQLKFAGQSGVERLEMRCMMAADLFPLSTASAVSANSTDYVQTAPLQGDIAECAVASFDLGHDGEFHDGPEYHAIPPVDSMHVAQRSLVSAPAAYPLTDTFRLHTNPGASKVIYLDFNGHTTSGTQWNNSFNGGNAFNTPAYSFEGDSSFSNSELERIQNIWERVAEDFSPFEVDVTTEDPGVDALRNTGGTDSRWGVRVAIGGDYSDWYRSAAGGVAYLDSFMWNTDTPCFVFTNNLGNGDEKSVAEAISHEAGHTLGLRHDGASGTDYYRGHGSGPTGWAPIMGVGYNVELVQWSRGDYPGARQTEDDLAIITSRNGFGYRADDHGGSVGAATPLTLQGSGVASSGGIIERNSDLDYFSFTVGTGALSLNINPFHRSPNLDILATLYNAAGSVVATSNPLNALGAAFNLSVSAGTYYLAIDGTGKPTGTDPGYSDYGSLGNYTFSVSATNNNNSEIDVAGNGLPIADGDTSPSTSDGTDFGSQAVASGAVSRTFTISNPGSGALNLTGTPRVQITGAQASDFSVSVQPASSVAPGGSTTFQIVFDPSAAGLRTALVSIISNDGNESLYDFVIQGTGTNVAADVAGDTLATALNTGLGAAGGFASRVGYIGDGAFGNRDVDLYSFQAAAGSGVTLQTTLPIGGTAMDTYLRLFDAAGNVLAADDDSGGSFLSLISNFTLTSAGTYYVGVSAYPNSTYNPAVGGSGADGYQPGDYQLSVTLNAPVTLPEMDVAGNGLPIADGDTSPSAADGTDFGSQDVASGGVSRIFTINNTGSGALNLTGTPRVQITGAQASDFSVLVQPASSVLPGGSTTFQILFDPSAAGLRTAVVSIVSNDGNERLYDFAIQGTGNSVVADVAGDTLSTALSTGLGAAGGTAATVGQIGGGIFGGMDVDLYSFQAAAGSSVTIHTTLPAGGATMDTYLRLFDAAGNLLAADDDSGGSFYSLISNVTLTSTGTYYVGVSGYPNIQYNPTVGGSGVAGATGDYHLALTLNAPVTLPEIEVGGNGLLIGDGDTSPSISDGTDFGSQDVASGAVARTFTIVNSGSGTLNLTGTPRVAITGAHASDFSVSALPASSVAPGSSTTFQIVFDPSAAGLRTALVSIISNDGNESLYDFVIQGTGTSAPTSITIDDGSAGFTRSGTWNNNSSTSAYQGDHRVSRSSNSRDTATWTFNALPSGEYQVLTRWVRSSNRLTNAPYQILDNATLRTTVNVNQRNAPSGVTADGLIWQNLGTVSITSGTLKVVLTDRASGTVSADAVRIIRTSALQSTAPLEAAESGAQREPHSREGRLLSGLRHQSVARSERAVAHDAALMPWASSTPSSFASEQATTVSKSVVSQTRNCDEFENGMPRRELARPLSEVSPLRHLRGALEINSIDSVFESLGAIEIVNFRASVL